MYMLLRTVFSYILIKKTLVYNISFVLTFASLTWLFLKFNLTK